MRRLLKFAAWVVAILLGLVALAALVVYLGVNRMLAATVTVPVPVEPIVIPTGDPAALARGQYLVDHVMGCKVCHAPDFGGRAEVDDALVGRLWAPNLTLGQGSATRNYTPVDWTRSIRHGVGTDGRRLILMPSEDYFGFSNEDLAAVVAYVTSMPPVDRHDEGIKVGPLGRVLLYTEQIRFAFDTIDHTRSRSGAKPSAAAEWGAVMIGACMGCHGPTLSGGPIPGAPPDWPPARNLTRHETGLRGWTYAQFSQAIREGRRPDGTMLSTVMPWKAYAGMTDPDVQALWAYLQTVEPQPLGGR